MTKYKYDNNLLQLFQSAYREHHSTETALLKILNDLLLSADNNRCIMLVLLDLSAAFDTIEHDILLRRLESDFNVTSTALGWMQSYLSNRTASVTVNGVDSEPRPLNVGLPQGSSVGPAEYVTYCSPVFGIAERHGINIHMYADDTQLYIDFDPLSYPHAVKKMEACLIDIKEWMNDNHLKLNDDKTEYLIIGKPALIQKIPGPHSLTLGSNTIVASNSAKNIGVTFDSALTLEQHVSNVCQACYAQLRAISRIRPNLTEDAAATLVHSFVTSRLDCCNSLLYRLSEKVIHKLQLVLNTAARIVTRSKRHERITPILRKLHWLPIRYRIDYKLCLMTFKCLNGIAPRYLSDLVEPYRPSRRLRSSEQNLLKRRSGKHGDRYGARSFAVAAPELWNKLPGTLRSCNDIDEFKRQLKTHLFTLAFV